MAETEFEQMLEAMPKIADAVSGLPQELQSRAFEELLASLQGRKVSRDETPRPPENPAEDPDEAADDAPGPETPTTRRQKAKANGKRSPRRHWTAVRNIDFRPQGKVAFSDLAAEKSPTSIDQKNLLAVYWLEQVAEISEVGVGHVLAAYKVQNWREPAQPDTQLRNTASAKHWLDTANMKSITTTPTGRNIVEHDMPIPPQKAKK
jgi:hypothetical protein